MNYFNNIENIEKCKEIVESWMGTPYVHLKAIKGRAADCSLLIAEILREMGILNNLEFDKYKPKDWCVYSHSQFILDTIRLNKSFVSNGLIINEYKFNAISELMFGDTLTFALKKKSDIVNHTGLYLDKNIIVHSVHGHKVEKSKLSDKYIRNLKLYFRVENL